MGSGIANFGAQTDDRGFFRTLATVMAIVQVSGFVFHLAMGRSSFNAPLVVHLHAVAYMGWVAIFAIQPWLAHAGAMKQHRQLGRLAAVWACALLVLGVAVTLAVVRAGKAPFFFQPQHFLFANVLGLVAALGLLAAAITLRKHTDWHARLQIGSFALLMGPSFGRLLPMPFLKPYAFEIAEGAALVFVAFAAARDARVNKAVHPAWLWTAGAMFGALALARLIAFSPLGATIYGAAVAGSAAAGGDGLAFPPAPPGF